MKLDGNDGGWDALMDKINAPLKAMGANRSAEVARIAYYPAQQGFESTLALYIGGRKYTGVQGEKQH